MKHSLCAMLALALAPLARAGTDIKPAKTVVTRSPLDKGALEVQIGVGGYSSISNSGQTRPQMDTLDGSVRLGWMLYSPSGDGILRGNAEFMLDLAGGYVVDGPGGGLVGLAMILRYNFVQDRAKWVPYLQIGAGGLYNTISENRTQRRIGSEWEVNLNAALGCRRLFSDRCYGFVEFGYRHISNADTSSRNTGLNSLGGLIGVGVFF